MIFWLILFLHIFLIFMVGYHLIRFHLVLPSSIFVYRVLLLQFWSVLFFRGLMGVMIKNDRYNIE